MNIPSSAIPTWLNTFNPSVYTKLVQQESYCYNNSIDQTTVNTWNTSFLNLASALLTWKNANRESLLTDWLPQLYGYISQILMYGETPGVSCSAYDIFSLNGLVSTIPGRAINYYSNTTLLQNDITTINGFSSAESSIVTSRTSLLSSYTKSKVVRLITSLTQPTITPTAKIDVLRYIYNNLNYSNVYSVLNVGSLTMPGGL